MSNTPNPSLPPPIPQAVLPYATPQSYQYSPQMGPWRDGMQLVASNNAVLPDRCIKCNAPTEGYKLKRTLYWHHPALYIMIAFPGLLIYAIVAMCVRKKAVVHLGLCSQHRSKRLKMIALTWLLSLGGLGVMIFGSVALSGSRATEQYIPFAVLGGVLLLIGGIIAGFAGARAIVPTKIDNHFAWYKGAGADYLATLPSAR